MSTTAEQSVEDYRPPESHETSGTEGMARGPMEMCPMPGMCMGMMQQGGWSTWLWLLPGVFLVAGGLLIILMPKVLVWLLGGTAMFMGIMFFFMAHRMRKLVAGMASSRGDGPCLSVWSR